MNLLFRGALIVDPFLKLQRRADVHVSGGIIQQVGEGLKVPCDAVDAEGLWLCPGFVDLHAHLREPGQEHKETLATGLAAAAAGGFTAVCAMANTDPPCDTPERVRFLLEKSRALGGAALYPIGAVTRGLKGEVLSEMYLMCQEGAAGFSDDGRGIQNAELMRRALVCAKALDAVIISHCEDDSFARGVFHEGTVGLRYGFSGLPCESELIPLVRDILLTQKVGARLHLAHVSCDPAIEWVRWAKKQGLPVTCEVTPHHLLLSDVALADEDALLKVNPPLRGPEDVAALRQAVLEGVVDAIATDHAPHAQHEKEALPQEAPCGIVGLETAVGLMLSLFFHRRIKGARWHPLKPDVGLTPLEIVSLFACGPRRVLGLPPAPIAEGSVADLTLIDPDASWRVEGALFKSLCKLTPFEGWELKGKPVMTVVRGKVVYDAQGRLEAGASAASEEVEAGGLESPEPAARE